MTSQIIAQHLEGPPQIDDISDFNHVFWNKVKSKVNNKMKYVTNVSADNRDLKHCAQGDFRRQTGAQPITHGSYQPQEEYGTCSNTDFGCDYCAERVTTEQHVATGSPYNAGTDCGHWGHKSKLCPRDFNY